ncbi:HNH endonuclease family protein [Streptomyces coryli]|uniref:HNH endonuclease family protein n=1 Tax=Streptomyces coryli TaxID=1128680 RepID=UPI001F0E69F5|nr:HNH endonuclease family protein [Streptomyces coryli]
MIRRPAASALLLLAVTLAAGCDLPAEDSGDDAKPGGGSTTTGPTATAAPGSALQAAEGLTAKGRAPKTGYDRDRFGSPWADTDSNGCPTRDDILRRDLTDTATRDDCEVSEGTLAKDPYSGQRVVFERGGPSEVDIDHIVALSDAWQKGAHRWPAAKRIAFANDPLNLLAVGASPNRSKGDGDAATWLPPKAFRCTYVARQVAVKKKYELWATKAEKQAITRVLGGCPDERLPGGGNPTKAPARFSAD